MRKEIENTLITMGFCPSVKGFLYIVNAIEVILKNDCQSMKVADIYAIGNSKEGVKYCSFDRNIRRAIETAYLNDAELYLELFKGQLPKLKAALYTIAYYIKNSEGGE